MAFHMCRTGAGNTEMKQMLPLAGRRHGKARRETLQRPEGSPEEGRAFVGG